METTEAVTALAGSRKKTASMSSACWSRPGRKAWRQVRSPNGHLAPNTLTFHFDRLRVAGLVTVRRDGRSMIYAARFDAMNGLVAFLTENCCQARKTVRKTNARPWRCANRRSNLRESPMKRFHVHVAVDDLKRSRLLLGVVCRQAERRQKRLCEMDA